MEMHTVQSLRAVHGITYGRPKTSPPRTPAPRHLLSWIAAGLSGLVAPLQAELDRRHAIAHLEGLDDRMLDDIGLLRADIADVVRGKKVADRRTL